MALSMASRSSWGRGRAVSTTARMMKMRLSTHEGLSFRTGPSEPALYTGTIPQHFAETVSRFGDRTAVVAREATPSGHETTLTYQALDVLSNRLASSLARELGVQKGDRVAVSLGNTAEFAGLTYACFKLGAVLVPLNPSFNAQQVEAALRHLGAEVLIMGAVTDLAYKPGQGRSNESLLTQVAGGDLSSSSSRIQSSSVPTLKHIVVVDNRAAHHHHHHHHDDGGTAAKNRGGEGLFSRLEECKATMPYRALLQGGSERPVTPARRLDAGDTINIQFTSGTTSTPKAAMLSHTAILNNGILIAHRMGLDPGDRIVVPPPLFHCFGSILGYMATATTGAAILFPSPAFDPVATLKMAADQDATGLYGVTTMLIAILEALDKDPSLSSSSASSSSSSASTPSSSSSGQDGKERGKKKPGHLKKGIVAGSSVPESLMRTIYERLGLQDLVNCYGMTETGPVSCMTSPRDPFEKRCASVGRPMPHTSVKIVRPGDAERRPVPVNTRGELATAGYLVMKGYYGDAAKTAQVRIAEAAAATTNNTMMMTTDKKKHQRQEQQKKKKKKNHDDDDDDDGGGDGKKDQRADKEDVVWMYTGDEAEMDSQGFVTITGRIKDLIIRGGENIYPLEIENCLFQMPGVSEVSVVGVPDEKLGESVAAFIIPRRQRDNRRSTTKKEEEQSSTSTSSTSSNKKEDGEEQSTSTSKDEGQEPSSSSSSSKAQVRDWVRTRLSSHLVPKHVFWVDELPKTASGKIQKFKLVKMAEDWLNTQSQD